MRPTQFGQHLLVIGIFAALVVATPAPVSAHCDTLDGPVVGAARRALEQGDVNLVLVWVKPGAEEEIRSAFRQTLAVRALGSPARDLADRYFFETLVRVHRAGEGAPYTGLRPAGQDLGPAVPAADRALESGDPGPLLQFLQETVGDGVRERFQDAMAAKSYRPDDLEAGREYVDRYVLFVHYVEGLYESASRSPEGHGEEGEPAEEAHGHGAR
jgi:hypothetical protein